MMLVHVVRKHCRHQSNVTVVEPPEPSTVSEVFVRYLLGVCSMASGSVVNPMSTRWGWGPELLVDPVDLRVFATTVR